jgi:hypothetical protein
MPPLRLAVTCKVHMHPFAVTDPGTLADAAVKLSCRALRLLERRQPQTARIPEYKPFSIHVCALHTRGRRAKGTSRAANQPGMVSAVSMSAFSNLLQSAASVMRSPAPRSAHCHRCRACPRGSDHLIALQPAAPLFRHAIFDFARGIA